MRGGRVDMPEELKSSRFQMRRARMVDIVRISGGGRAFQFVLFGQGMGYLQVRRNVARMV